MKKTKCKDGYMSVEAAFIVAWSFVITIWLIYLGYFEYDRALLFQDNYTLATQTLSYIATNEDKQNWLSGHISAQKGKKYLGTGSLSIGGNVDRNKVRMASEGTPVKLWHMSDTVEVDNFSFTKRLRVIRAMGRVIGGD